MTASARVSQHLVTTGPHPALCLKCDSLILIGIAEGISYSIDPDPLNHAGEVAAILDGLDTWEMCARRIVSRDASRIQYTTPETRVFTSHACHRPIPDFHRSPIAKPLTIDRCDCGPEGHRCPPPF